MDSKTISYILTRRVHSLIGMVSLGLFIFSNLILGTLMVKNPNLMSGWTVFVDSVPILRVLEFLVIIIPIIFYLFYTMIIAYNGSSNTMDYSFLGNWLYFLNRIAATVMLVFVLYHIYAVHLHCFVAKEPANLIYLKSLISSKSIMVFYLIGTLATIFNCAIAWMNGAMIFGLTATAKSRKLVSIKMWLFVFTFSAWGFWLITKISL